MIGGWGWIVDFARIKLGLCGVGIGFLWGQNWGWFDFLNVLMYNSR